MTSVGEIHNNMIERIARLRKALDAVTDFGIYCVIWGILTLA
jgi:hypothetical protein